MGFSKDQLLARLQELQIDFVSYNHPAVLTVEAQAKYVGHLGGALSKNLLLKDKKHRYYVVSALAGTNVDLKVLSQRLGLGKGGLRMAPEEALQELLQVPLGCVTPFSLVNDSARNVSLLLDQGFKAQQCCFFHPLSNDTTVSISARDLDKFLVSIGRNPSYVDLEATPLVGKDQPPDLAAFVPSGNPVLPISEEKAVPVQLPTENHVPAKNKLIDLTGQTKTQTNHAKGAVEKPQNSSNPFAAVTDVRKFVDEIIVKTSDAVLSEIAKESTQQQGQELKPVVLDGVRKHLSLELENLTMTFKNAAYTQGFTSGVKSMSLQK
ncbi:ybaK/aminoacyl-tRNA synthetase-associated domain-containing protein [Tasmannia lanceolata]|uniref:ybaK/aminoacyl-tRNA synthetase-associated domain-containing protein n=1 Tax=Tasmannia lanceolata TaxID=3420 RepID=UPI004063AE77